jgi:hypothetical protein
MEQNTTAQPTIELDLVEDAEGPSFDERDRKIVLLNAAFAAVLAELEREEPSRAA